MHKVVVPKKEHWLDRAVSVHNYHVAQCRDEPGWTIEKTAVALERSVGSVSQDITLASWVRTHEKVLRRFVIRNDALEWIKLRKREMQSKEIEI